MSKLACKLLFRDLKVVCLVTVSTKISFSNKKKTGKSRLLSFFITIFSKLWDGGEFHITLKLVPHIDHALSIELKKNNFKARDSSNKIYSFLK